MPLINGKSKESFVNNMKTEMNAGKPKAQSLAIAYAMKRKAKKMAEGGFVEEETASGMEPMPMEHEVHNMMAEEEDNDMLDKIMAQRYSKGGMVANGGMDDLDQMADGKPNNFDDLSMRDELEGGYTGANSGDMLGNAQEDMDREDIISKIMKSRAKKDRLPNPR